MNHTYITFTCKTPYINVELFLWDLFTHKITSVNNRQEFNAQVDFILYLIVKVQ